MDSINADSVDINLDDDVLDESLDDDTALLQETINGANGNHDDQLLGTLSNPGQDEIQERLKKIEEEAQKIRDMQSEMDRQFSTSSVSVTSSQSQQPPVHLSLEEKAELDARSVYVGNVEYAATPDQLEEHFRGCGPIERVTILSDKFTGHPKGFAYIQFTEIDGMQNALALDESLFLGRQIKVGMKRTNKPGFSSTNRPPRGRGARGRGAGRGFGGFRGARGLRRGRGAPRGFTPY
uniref:RRM domain-containing protein n=1 Tax=Panagrolaimus superbus TaxID=310955 RepID=A0A914YJ50_9BILA